jgi:hypothetical protein
VRAIPTGYDMPPTSDFLHCRWHRDHVDAGRNSVLGGAVQDTFSDGALRILIGGVLIVKRKGVPYRIIGVCQARLGLTT